MSHTEHRYIHAFNLLSGIGSQKLTLLHNHFASFEKAWHGSHKDFADASLSPKLIDTILTAQKTLSPEDEWHKLTQENISLVTIHDANFPQHLTTIPDTPFALYVRGNTDILDKPSIAIVGSRKYSTYGKHAVTCLAQDLAQAGIAVVSGLALGVDALAHKSALDSKMHASTIAVLGGGIDDASIAPRSHVGLAQLILANGGLLLSEYTPGTTPNRGTFPARNRIMAGMTDGTLVIEAGAHSGTLITAEHAQTYGKKLFAVPGSIFTEESVGTNTLIMHGAAQLVRNANDIISTLNISPSHSPQKERDYSACSPDEITIIETLTAHPEGLSIDKIIRLTTLEGSIISQTLVMMEIDGLIKDLGGGRYVIL